MKLTKIRLINWHIFTNNTFDLYGNMLITGENGNGKSTLLDALYFVLSGGEDKNFNSAANEKSNRSITTYVRGKLGHEGKDVLRNESTVVCHIALEFFDEFQNLYSTLGSVIEIVDTAKPRIKFYIVRGLGVGDIKFIIDNDISSYSDLKQSLASKDFTELNSSKYARVKEIAEFFHIKDGKRYTELLKNSIAFHPLNMDVSGFVNDFLLSDNSVNIDALREELRSYREISETIKRERKKLDQLETFVEKAEKWLKNNKEIKYLNALKNEVELNQFKRECEKLNRIIVETEKKKDDAIKKISEFSRKRNELEIQISLLENNEAYKAIKLKEDRTKSLKEKLNECEIKINQIESKLKSEAVIVRQLGLKYNFIEDIKNKRIDMLNEHVQSYILEIKKISDELAIKINGLDNTIQGIVRDISDYNKQLEKLRIGKNNYGADVIRLIDILKREIREQDGVSFEVYPLCECIEIKEKEWSNAVEGYLNTHRFDLIIDPAYFDAAVKVYEDIKDREKLYGLGIIDTRKREKLVFDNNSLYTKITVLNPLAEGICKLLLGHVIAVDNVRDLKNYRASITSSCMLYKNLTVRAINPKIYEIPFVGKDSAIQRKKLIEGKIKQLQADKVNNENTLEKVKNKKHIIENSKLSNDVIKDEWLTAENIRCEIFQLEDQIKEETKNNNLIDIRERIEKYKTQIESIRSSIGAIEKERSSLETSIGANNNELNIKKGQVSTREEEVSSLRSELIDLLDYEEFSNGIEKNLKSINEALTIRTNSNNAIRSVIDQGITEYATKYNLNLMPNINAVEDYIAEYNRIKQTDIVSLEAQSKIAFNNARRSFNENFISKLYEKIELAKKELKRINDNLKKHPFGRDKEVYQFVWEASRDQEMRDYYNIIMSGKDFEKKDLFTEALDKKDLAIMQNLFDKIALEDNLSQAEQQVKKYLDYRQYLYYDIKITNERDEVSYFSKTKQGKSGGESQTPFYVIVAACFEELIKHDGRNVNACLVVFDEAFNNMDEPRIITLMDYYKELNLQLFIVVPSNRSHNIIPHIDTALALIKNNNFVRGIYLKNNG